MTKYNIYEKRDGSILCVFKDEDGKIQSSEEAVNEMIINHLRSIQQERTTKSNWDVKLKKLDREETLAAIEKMSWNKGVAFDLCPDNFCRLFCNKKTVSERYLNLIQELWTIPIQNIPNIHFKAKIIALNKVHPEIPKKGQFRPIVVMSPLIKLLEMRFYSKLMKFCEDNIVKAQFGFIKGCGTDANLFKLTRAFY